MPDGVACSVSNCSYWKQGNACGAKEIAIEIDAHSRNRWNEEFAEEFGGHKDESPSSAGTCCLTFKPQSEK